ncbi:MAG: helix-turn-helix domain-containing protein [Clostridiaceae bacterium]|nr:helix-turn-helix domain-containing protein [Clostridiaceae bacterium]
MGNSVLGMKLKELRKAHGYTQEDVAVVLDIGRKAYSHYETGRNSPSLEMLYKLAGLYSVPIEDLLHASLKLDENVYYDAPVPTQSSTDLTDFLEYFNTPAAIKKYQQFTFQEKELLYYYNKMSDCDKEDILEFIKMRANRKSKC